MTTSDDAPIEALRNIKTGKLFVCLEAADSPGCVRVVNPGGEIKVIPEELFDLEPILVPAADALAHFSPAQVEGIAQFRKEQAELLEWRRRHPERTIVEQKSEPSKASGERRPRKKLAPLLNVKGRVVAEWKDDKLIFYRHRIEPLKDHESFIAHVDGAGSFQMTKSEFQRVFNNVIMSSGYRTHGMFKYDAIPAEAEPFRKKTNP